jgi:hypothetical protein
VRNLPGPGSRHLLKFCALYTLMSLLAGMIVIDLKIMGGLLLLGEQ